MEEQFVAPVKTIESKLPEVVKKIRGTVSIKAYVSGQPNMGHEKYDEVLFPNTEQLAVMMCHVKDNIKTYVTGLNEFSADIQSIEDPKEKTARIKEIREIVAFLENTANANFKVSPKDCMLNYGKVSDRGESLDTFWDNVGMFQSVCVDKYDAKGNRILTYWDRISVKLDNDGRTLNMKDPHDLALYYGIMANGMGLIANSLQQAIDEPGYNFYLHKPEDVANIKIEFKQLRNRAGGYLETMKKEDEKKLFYMAILCAPIGAAQYKYGGYSATPIPQLYEDLDNYISGKVGGVDTKEATKKFLDYYEIGTDEMTVRCVIKVATELRLIDLKPNGQLCYLKTGAQLGKNIEDMVVHMQQTLNEDTWISLLKTVEAKWRE